jgi:D-sedoheptulose 7-phosphate isomerase
MEDLVRKRIDEAIEAHRKFCEKNSQILIQVSMAIIEAFRKGNKLLLFGNGGSAADAQHIASEFVNRFSINRGPLPAIALTTDSSVITSISNDDSFSEIFRRQIKAMGKKGDIAWAISTSGKSENVLNGLIAARDEGLITIAMTGMDGGTIGTIADFHLHVESMSVPRIQEVHITAGHIICEMVDIIYLKENS